MKSPSTDTRALIRALSIKVIAEEGLSSLSLRQIAKRAKISAPGIYKHFADKDALLAEIVVDSFRLFGGYLAESQKARTPLARFRKTCQRYVDFSQEHPHNYRLIFMTDGENLGYTKLDEAQEAEIQQTFTLLIHRVAEVQSSGEFRAGDPVALARFVWSSLHGLCSLVLTGSLTCKVEEASSLAAHQLRMIETALAAENVEQTGSRMTLPDALIRARFEYVSALRKGRP